MPQLTPICGPQGDFVQVDANIDWITATHTHGNDRRSAYDFGREMVEAEARKGNDIQPLNWRGYHGFRAGHCSVGSRGDGVFLQARSGVAMEYLGGVLKYATNVSRIDCAVTALLDHRQPEVFRKGFEVLNRPHKVGHKRAKPTLRANDDYGDSLEFGRRTSDRFGRLYDKGMEQRIAESGWYLRWEVECKNAWAKAVAASLRANNSPSLVAHKCVSTYFDNLRVRSPRLLLEASGVSLVFAHAALTSQDSRRLSWLGRTCGPILAGLYRRGALDMAIEALGLSVVDGKISLAPKMDPFPIGGCDDDSD